MLGLSVRQVRRLLAALRSEGAVGPVHGNTGVRPSTARARPSGARSSSWRAADTSASAGPTWPICSPNAKAYRSPSARSGVSWPRPAWHPLDGDGRHAIGVTRARRAGRAPAPGRRQPTSMAGTGRALPDAGRRHRRRHRHGHGGHVPDPGGRRWLLHRAGAHRPALRPAAGGLLRSPHHLRPRPTRPHPAGRPARRARGGRRGTSGRQAVGRLSGHPPATAPRPARPGQPARTALGRERRSSGLTPGHPVRGRPSAGHRPPPDHPWRGPLR